MLVPVCGGKLNVAVDSSTGILQFVSHVECVMICTR